MINLKKGGIYYYRTTNRLQNFESLIQVTEIKLNGIIILELATDHSRLTSKPTYLRKELFEDIKKEVPLEELPLYIHMEKKSPEFMDLIKRGLS